MEVEGEGTWTRFEKVGVGNIEGLYKIGTLCQLLGSLNGEGQISRWWRGSRDRIKRFGTANYE